MEVVFWSDEDYERLLRCLVYEGPCSVLPLYGNPPKRKFNKAKHIWED